jgi:hypothetical protein
LIKGAVAKVKKVLQQPFHIINIGGKIKKRKKGSFYEKKSMTKKPLDFKFR